MSRLTLPAWLSRLNVFKRPEEMLGGAPSTLWVDSRQVEWAWRGKHNAPLRWSLLGLLMGLILALVCFAPASWMAKALAQATGQHLLLTDTRGSIWSGSGVLVLGGGKDSRDFSALPGRISWSLGLSRQGLLLEAEQACCINGKLQMLIQPGFGTLAVSLPPQGEWLARLPASILGGLGTPWNTLQLGGSLRIAARDFRIELSQGRWVQKGQLDLDFVNMSSRVSTVAPLGSYRFSINADPANAGVSILRLVTLDGALLLSGEGSVGGAKARFQGEASAAAGREMALNNLLNIIGRRQGDRSIISIG